MLVPVRSAQRRSREGAAASGTAQPDLSQRGVLADDIGEHGQRRVPDALVVCGGNDSESTFCPAGGTRTAEVKHPQRPVALQRPEQRDGALLPNLIACTAAERLSIATAQ